MDVKYEKARVDDLYELNQLIERHSPKTGRRLIRADRSTIHRFFLALDENDKIIGYSRIYVDYFPMHLMRHELKKTKKSDSDSVKRGEITDVFVAPGFRRRGIGTKLVELAADNMLNKKRCDFLFAKAIHPESKMFNKWAYEKYYPRYTLE
jgi:ribosomal protein S18 acetylase RimI-like enzyme